MAKSGERKCDSCGQWNVGSPKICEHCGKYVDLRVLENEKKEERRVYEEAEKIREFENKPPVIRFFIRIGRLAETVFIAIVTFFAWFIFWLGG